MPAVEPAAPELDGHDHLGEGFGPGGQRRDGVENHPGGKPQRLVDRAEERIDRARAVRGLGKRLPRPANDDEPHWRRMRAAERVE